MQPDGLKERKKEIEAQGRGRERKGGKNQNFWANTLLSFSLQSGENLDVPIKETFKNVLGW